VRVAVWTPMPPEPSGIADYNLRLLATMARDPRLELTAIVREAVPDAVAPLGVRLCTAGDYDPDDFDIDLYHMGNNPTFHSYMFSQIVRRPGVLMLHDPAIVDFIDVVLGGLHRRIFADEVAYNLGLRDNDYVKIHEAIVRWDRLELLMSRRIVEHSLVTLVHSEWAADELRRRFDIDDVRAVPHAVWTDGPVAPARKGGPVSFGVFGSISAHKRLSHVVDAFAEVRASGIDATLVIAGRRDNPTVENQLEILIDRHNLGDVITMDLDTDDETYTRYQEDCDVMVGLRWPTTGETSGPLLACFAMAKAAIVSDLPQNREFDDGYCRKVSLEPEREHDELVAAMTEAAADVDATRRAGLAAREYVTTHCDDEIVAAKYYEALASALSRLPPVAPAVDDAVGALAINAIGSWAGATGLAEAGRRAVIALLDEGTLVAIEDVNLWAKVDEARLPDRIKMLPQGHPYPIDVSFLNVNEFHVVTQEQLGRGPGSYLIAMWYWELPALPADMIREIARVDEIWVASEFVRDVFLRYTDKPVVVMPCVVEPEVDESVAREQLGLPEEGPVIYLVTFDANSTIARKNPYGAIKAFEEAFGCGRTDVVLVIKVVNLGRYPVVQRDMRAHVARLGGILIETDMAPGEIGALIKFADVYVSMHRSEGFGLGLAESMYFGRPVIATANSGNMQFMNNHNSCLVGYSSKVVDRNDLSDNPHAMVLYQPGNLWVEPDVSGAARWMRWLFDHPEERERIGAVAATHIRENFSSAAAGRAMRARLEEVNAHVVTLREMARKGYFDDELVDAAL